MRTIGLVALHVFRDSVRDKVLYSIVAFAVVLMAVSYLIGQLTAGEDLKIIKDLGLAAMSLMGLFIAVFIGIGLIAREIDRRSIYCGPGQACAAPRASCSGSTWGSSGP
jgi:ABC-type transport system involved in multi-copper enzyme maturation permease subunit